MNNWKKCTLVAIMVTAAGFAYFNNSRPHIPSDLRDAVADNGEFNTAIPVLEKDNGNIPVPKAAHVKSGASDIAKSYLTGPAGEPSKPVEWVAINGGKFTMGTDEADFAFRACKPAHEVTIKTFEMSKTAVTVEQYAQCVANGECKEPLTADYCNWGKAGRRLHPINCVDWHQANQYARFKGARLPSESEWEYAAKSGGKNQKYPWGDEAATCDKAVMYGNGDYGCGKNDTMPVCSKPAGNTAQGLCDMAGNVWQWVQDTAQMSYKGVPVDGSAFEGQDPHRVMRGGSYYSDDVRNLRADYRGYYVSSARPGNFGFRIARSTQKDAGLDMQKRIEACYSGPHLTVETLWSDTYVGALSLEAGRAFLKCQMAKEPQLEQENPQQSSSEVIKTLAGALGKDLPEFAKVFDLLFK